MSSALLTRVTALAVLLGLATAAVAADNDLARGETEFLGMVSKAKTRPTYTALLGGKEQADPKNKDHLVAIDHAAKGLVYPLHWYSLGRNGATKKMIGQVDTFATYLSRMTRAREQTRVMQYLFTRSVVDRCVEVIGEGKPIAGVNAARMLAIIVERRADSGSLEPEKKWAEDVLPRLAEGNAEHYANALLTLFDHKKANAGVRYYLLRGMANLMALPPQETALLKKETEEKLTRAALKVVETQVKFPKATPRDEVEGYKVLRQQAVAVLAQARVPSLSAKEKPSLVLARVAAGDPAIAPPPRLAERIEATIGLARLTARSKDANYQPDYAAEVIARGVLAFALQANKNLDSRVLDSKSSPDALPRARTWKVDAARLLEAVELLKASKDKYVLEVVREAAKVLRPIENNQQAPASDFGDWLDRNAAPNKGLLKKDDASTVKALEEKAG